MPDKCPLGKQQDRGVSSTTNRKIAKKIAKLQNNFPLKIKFV